MIIRGVNIFPSSVEQILRSFPEVVEYRLTAYKSGAMDGLVVEIEDRLEQLRPARRLGRGARRRRPRGRGRARRRGAPRARLPVRAHRGGRGGGTHVGSSRAAGRPREQGRRVTR